MNLNREVKAMLNDVLHLEGRASAFDEKTPLLGSVPELDSMAVVALIAAIEERFDCMVNDDEIDGAVFATFGSLLAFVHSKTGALAG